MEEHGDESILRALIGKMVPKPKTVNTYNGIASEKKSFPILWMAFVHNNTTFSHFHVAPWVNNSI